MRIIAEYVKDRQPLPLLRLFIHWAPHRRQHTAVLQKYREELVRACTDAKIKTPISNPIDLWVMFINPCSGDLGNAYLALERALDANSLKGPSVLTDDSLVYGLTASKFYPQGESKR